MEHLEDKEDILTTQLNALQEENRRLRTFAQVVAHDLRNPLSTAYSYHAFLNEVMKAELCEEQYKLFDAVGRKVAHSMDLVDALLEYSMSGNPHAMVSTSVTTMIEQSLFILSKKLKDRDGTVEVDIRSDEIFCNIDLMTNVFVNLIDNAIKYCPDYRSPFIKINCVKDGKDVVISIIDNGKGIPVDKYDTIFVEFERADAEDYQKGHGIGLSTVKRIINSHNGDISIKSKEQVGTTFTIRFKGE
jgi:signal transduction histidine kinase